MPKVKATTFKHAQVTHNYLHKTYTPQSSIQKTTSGTTSSFRASIKPTEPCSQQNKKAGNTLKASEDQALNTSTSVSGDLLFVIQAVLWFHHYPIFTDDAGFPINCDYNTFGVPDLLNGLVFGGAWSAEQTGLPLWIVNLRRFAKQIYDFLSIYDNLIPFVRSGLESFMDKANELASKETVSFRSGTIKEKYKLFTVDLHFLLSKEVEKFCDSLFKKLRENGFKNMSVVIGTGIVGPDGESKLGEAALAWAKRMGIKYYWNPCPSVLCFDIFDLCNTKHEDLELITYADFKKKYSTMQ